MRAIILYAVEHRVTMLMVTLAAVLFGVVSLGRLPVQLLPEISYPTLTVQTEYPDSAPNEVENLISRPIEEGVGVVPGLRRLSSVSRAGVSEITLEFGWDTDMDFAGLDVREKIDLVSLPDEAKTPVLLRYDPTLDPVVRLGVSGVDNPVLLRYLAEQVIKKELESVKGIAAAKALGGLQGGAHRAGHDRPVDALGRATDHDVGATGQVGAEDLPAAAPHDDRLIPDKTQELIEFRRVCSDNFSLLTPGARCAVKTEYVRRTGLVSAVIIEFGPNDD